MKSRERFYAVIGGCAGALLTLILCSFLPLGAQSEGTNFGDITCTGLSVVDSDGNALVRLSTDERGGYISVRNPNAVPKVLIFPDENGGNVYVYGKEVKQIAGMGINEYGGVIAVGGKLGKSFVHIFTDELGGGINVAGRDGTKVGSLP